MPYFKRIKVDEIYLPARHFFSVVPPELYEYIEAISKRTSDGNLEYLHDKDFTIMSVTHSCFIFETVNSRRLGNKFVLNTYF